MTDQASDLGGRDGAAVRRTSMPRVRLSFAARFVLLVAGAVALSVLVGGWWTYASVRNVLIEQELRDLSAQAALATGPLEVVVAAARADVALLEQSPSVPAWIRAVRAGGVDPVSRDDLATWRERLDATMVAMVRSQSDYDQVRFIGVADSARELVKVERVAGDARLVPDEELQTRADRAYLQQAFELGPGQNYVSNVELHRDNGAIRDPWVPTMRVVRPVFDDSGELFGGVVINVDLTRSFREIQTDLPDGWRAYVVNDEGDFLVHPDTSRTFRFEFGERAGLESEFTGAAEAFATDAGRTGNSYLLESGDSDAGIGFYQWAFDPNDADRYVGVVLAEDYGALSGSAAAARNRAISFAMLMLPVAILFGWLTVRQVTSALGAQPAELEAISAIIADGTLDVELPGVEGERGGVLGSLEGMLTHLRAAREERQGKAWLRDNLSELLGTAQRCASEQELASTMIGLLAETLEAAQGLFYSVSSEEERVLRLAGTYAYDPRKRAVDRVAFGEGLVGQAATDRKIHTMRGVPESYLTIGSGLGQAPPATVVAVPLAYENETLAVIELATFGDFEGTKGELLTDVADDLSVTLWGLRGKGRAQELMRVAQESAEELQATNEELRVTNEELETRSEELRRQSDELQALNVELEEKSEELGRREAEAERKRTLIEKQHEELERTSRQLAEASRYKSEFLANMSHELRTPLNSLLILSQGLHENSEGNLTPDQVRAAQIIHSGGQELLDLINDILDLSKIEAGKVEVQAGEVSLSDAVADLQRQFQPVADKAGVELRVELDPELPQTIATDRQRATQIVKNFLSNAFKFTKQGSVTLTVERRDADVAFRVQDTGIGIPTEKQRIVFEAFQQADGSTSREYGGTGLGLTISRNLARLLGGAIELQSTEGVGSTFSLILPLEFGERVSTPEGAPPGSGEGPVGEGTTSPAPAASTPEIDADAGEASADEPPREDWIPDDRDALGGRRPVLVVEDDRGFAEILVKLARDRGHGVVATPSGRRAMRLAKAYEPLAVVLDLNLPDISGLDVLTFFKKELSTRHVPVHVISAVDERIASLSAGAVGFAAKPTSKADLEDVFSRLEAAAGERPKAVLVVEDDDVAAAALEEALSVAGTTVTRVGTLEETGRALREDTFDCVVLDLRLPDGSGLDFLERWRADGGPPLPPVVVHTAQELDDDTYRRLRAASEEIVLKGVSSTDRVLDEVTIFLHTVDAALNAEQRSALAALRDTDQTIRGKRVLVVDDDLRNSFALSQALSKRGLEVVLAEDGQQALERLQGDPDFHIVLMDIMMPRMDGYEAMRRLRADARFNDLPIIALTAKAMPEDRQKCLDAGANDYLSKPVDVNRLLSVMRVWMFGS